jgi:hypothetical protein
MQGFVTELGNALGKSGAIGIAKDLINSLSNGAKSMLGNYMKGLSNELMHTKNDTFDIDIPGFKTISIEKDKLIKFFKAVQGSTGVVGKLQETQQKNLNGLRPEDQNKYQSESLAQFTEMNQSLKEANGLKKLELARRSLISPPNMTTA